VTTVIKSFFPGDPATVWADLAAEVEIEVIPGTHLNIVTTQFEALASVLQYLFATSNKSYCGHVDDTLKPVVINRSGVGIRSF